MHRETRATKNKWDPTLDTKEAAEEIRATGRQTEIWMDTLTVTEQDRHTDRARRI